MTKKHAYEYWCAIDGDDTAHKPALVPMSERILTRKFQYYLFMEVYRQIEAQTIKTVTKHDVSHVYAHDYVINWDNIPKKVREVLVDMTYRVDNTGKNGVLGNTREWYIPALVTDLKEGLSGENSHFYTVMADEKQWCRKYGVSKVRVKNRVRALL